MELKTAEEQVNEISSLYGRLQERHAELKLPPLSASSPGSSGRRTESLVDAESSVVQTPTSTGAKSILDALEDVKKKLESLEPKMTKFQARSQESDPVTGNPRYGPSTHARVVALLRLYNELVQHIDTIFLGKGEMDGSISSEESTVIDRLRQKAEEQELLEQQRQRQERDRLEREEAIRKAEREKILDEERERQNALRDQAERERQDQERHQEEALLAERRAREAADRADREWVSSITKGPEGVKEHLEVLLEVTANDPESQLIALQSLHTIFSQITARPEETNFRRIRRNHEKFNTDIGRHKGGTELLIASGFELGTIDDVQCFICKEPNIESSLDEWSVWFDLIKATLDTIEQQLLVRKNRP